MRQKLKLKLDTSRNRRDLAANFDVSIPIVSEANQPGKGAGHAGTVQTELTPNDKLS